MRLERWYARSTPNSRPIYLEYAVFMKVVLTSLISIRKKIDIVFLEMH